MREKKIVGTASSFVGLLHLLSHYDDCIINIEGMIDCEAHEFHLNDGQVLRGNNDKSGLKFNFAAWSSTALKLSNNTGLENICLEINAQKASRHGDHACIIVEGKSVHLKNVAINLSLKDDDVSSKKTYPAIYLHQRAEVEGFLKISAKGLLATAIHGNSSCQAVLALDNGNLYVDIHNSIRPSISKCQVEISNGSFCYVNKAINPPLEEFVNAAVYFGSNTEFSAECLASPKVTMDAPKMQARLELFNCLDCKWKRHLIKTLSFWKK